MKMSKSAVIVLFGAALIISLAVEAAAGDEDHATRIQRIEERLAHIDADTPLTANFPITFTGRFTGILQGMTRARDVQDSNPIDPSYSADLYLEGIIGPKDRFFAHIEAGDGQGITDEAVTLNGVNADAIGNGVFRMSEAFYEHIFGDDFLTLNVGKLNASAYFDANTCANDEPSQFLSNAFVNSVAIPFPAYTSGVQGKVKIFEGVEWQTGYFESQSDWEDFGDSAFVITELDLAGKIFGGDGNLRLGYWKESLDRVRLSNALMTCAEGWGLNFDWVKPVSLFSRSPEQKTHLGFFGRYNVRSGDIADWIFDRAWSAGTVMTGLIPSRHNDSLGLAFGRAQLSSEYLKFGIGGADNRVFFGDEDHWEAYYRIAFNDRVYLTPNVQKVINRNGDKRNEDFTAIGMRLEVTF